MRNGTESVVNRFPRAAGARFRSAVRLTRAIALRAWRHNLGRSPSANISLNDSRLCSPRASAMSIHGFTRWRAGHDPAWPRSPSHLPVLLAAQAPLSPEGTVRARGTGGRVPRRRPGGQAAVQSAITDAAGRYHIESWCPVVRCARSTPDSAGKHDPGGVVLKRDGRSDASARPPRR